MDAIALGCLTAMLVARRKLSRRALSTLLGCGMAMMAFCLVFTIQSIKLGLERSGLGMTVVAVGACMVIVAAAQSKWRAARVFQPLLGYGRRSYEIYLTHMFVVFAFFDCFMKAGKPVHFVPLPFIATVLVAGALGELVARFYSEPANRWLRARFGDGPNKLGSVVEASTRT